MVGSYKRIFKRILIIGVGGSGCKAVKEVVKIEKIPYLLIDTDAEELNNIEGDKFLLIGKSITNGLSAGGDVEIGRQAIEKDAIKIRSIFQSIDLIIITGGLGGGTASGSIPVLARLAREAGSQSMVLSSLPFIFEGKQKLLIAEESIKRMRSHTDAIIKFSNEKLKKKLKNEQAEIGYQVSHKFIKDAIESIWIICSKPSICGLDFSSIHTILRYCDGFCNFASVHCNEKENRSKFILSELMNHSLMNKGLLWKNAPGVIISIRGNKDLLLKEIEEIMEKIINEISDDAWINYGIQLDEKIEGINVVALIAETWNESLIDSNDNLFDRNKEKYNQGTLNLKEYSKGVFSEMDPTVYNNEDLDIPTFRRRKIKLPK
ncbi:MAG: hypothetical protein ACJ0BW_01380 [Pontiellaceae bacterium]